MGANTIKIKVTAGDTTTTKTYTVTVTRTIDPPGAPGSLTAVAGDAGAFLIWTAPASDGGSAILRYEYRYKSGADDYPATWTAVPDGPDAGTDAADETFATVTGLTNGDAHTFELRAVNSEGGGTAAESSAVTPATAAACAAPTYTGGAREVFVGTLTVGIGHVHGLHCFGVRLQYPDRPPSAASAPRSSASVRTPTRSTSSAIFPTCRTVSRFP